jgi:o-succinylbenzoate---CoA ligase
MVVDLLQDVLNRAASAHRPMLVSPEGSWTLAELDDEVDARSGALAGEGVAAGQVQTLVAEATAPGVIDLLAHWRLGATVAPLSPRLTDIELRRARDQLSDVRSHAQAVLWTSGTSGHPRGVEISYENLVASAHGSATRMLPAPSDVWLATLSPAHVGGLALITRALILGADLLAWGGFDAAVVSGLIDGLGLPIGYDSPVTHVSLVPTQLLRLLDHRAGSPPPETFRYALIGGAHAPARLIERAQADGWPLAVTYGMTEMTSQVATALPELVRVKPGTVGAPIEGVEVRVADNGEVWVRGATRALGYLGQGAASLADEAGWYHTGDMGRLDEDGDLWITGRHIERIVSGGVTIDAIEIEEVLRGHPGVYDACVVGVPDDEWGECVAVLLVPVEGRFDLAAVKGWAHERLATAKRPRRWLIRNELPRNTNGKVDRRLVRDLLDGD